MDGSDLCYEVVRRASSGFVYSEAVARQVEFIIKRAAVDMKLAFLRRHVQVQFGNKKERAFARLSLARGSVFDN